MRCFGLSSQSYKSMSEAVMLCTPPLPDLKHKEAVLWNFPVIIEALNNKFVKTESQYNPAVLTSSPCFV